MPSQAAGKLYASPARTAVTKRTVDRWPFDYAAVLDPGETIDGAAVTLTHIDPDTDAELATVPDFASSVTHAGTKVSFVADGSVLVVGEVYLLEVVATLS